MDTCFFVYFSNVSNSYICPACLITPAKIKGVPIRSDTPFNYYNLYYILYYIIYYPSSQ